MNTKKDFIPVSFDAKGTGRIKCPYSGATLVIHMKRHEPFKCPDLTCPKCSNKLVLETAHCQPATPHLQEGTTLEGNRGTYVLQKVLGHGFMGYTYLAEATLRPVMVAFNSKGPDISHVKIKP